MTSTGHAAVADTPGGPDAEPTSSLEVFRNRPFLLLWLSQAFTQVGGNMVLYGLTVIVLETTRLNTMVSLLILTFLVPAVLFSAVAGVYVDRFDRRVILIVTNVLRAIAFVAMYLVGANLALIFLLNIIVSSLTVFFAPAEAAMIPTLVQRRLLISANGLFTLTLNAAFAVGFALLGPIVVRVAGAPALLLIVAACYLVAAVFCWTLPPSPPPAKGAALDPRTAVSHTEQAVGSVLGQLREGLAYIRENPRIAWSLVYLGIAASLVGVLGVLGPDFARDSLGLEPKDLVVVVLPLAFGIVTGILLLNSFGHMFPRRRLIESGLVSLGVLLVALSLAGPIARFLQGAEAAVGFDNLAAFTSLLSVVVAIALLAGIAYAFVAISAQTQLQLDLPLEVRGRVFGVLNMLVSVSSFLPIIIVGPVSDVVGTTNVIVVVALFVAASGAVSILTRGPIRPAERGAGAGSGPAGPVDPVSVALAAEFGPDGAAGDPAHMRSAPPYEPDSRPAPPEAGGRPVRQESLDDETVPDSGVPGDAR